MLRGVDMDVFTIINFIISAILIFSVIVLIFKLNRKEKYKLTYFFSHYVKNMNPTTNLKAFKSWEAFYDEIYDYFSELFKSKDNLKDLSKEKKIMKRKSNSIKIEKIDIKGHIASMITILAMLITTIVAIIFSSSATEGFSIDVKEYLLLIFNTTLMLFNISIFVYLLMPLLFQSVMKEFYQVCLDTLEQIEKEIKEDQQNKEHKQHEGEVLELLRQISENTKHENRNDSLKNTILPTIAEIAVTSLLEKSVFKKFIKKDKEK